MTACMFSSKLRANTQHMMVNTRMFLHQKQRTGSCLVFGCIANPEGKPEQLISPDALAKLDYFTMCLWHDRSAQVCSNPQTTATTAYGRFPYRQNLWQDILLKAGQVKKPGTAQAQGLACAQSLGVCEGDIGWRCPVSLLVGNDLDTIMRPYTDAPVNSPLFLVEHLVQAALVSVLHCKTRLLRIH